MEKSRLVSLGLRVLIALFCSLLGTVLLYADENERAYLGKPLKRSLP